MSVPQHTRQTAAGAEAPFATAHLLDGMRLRAASSSAAAISGQFGKLLLNVAGTIVLVRLLAPEDFGLVAMVATVIGFVRVFKDVGLSTVTVQREGITHAQVSNLFWINTFVSTSTAVALTLAAPLLVWFYREPRLLPITAALSSALIASGLTAQHTAILQRQMRLKSIAVIDILSMVVGLAVAITMATLNFGYWSLVAMNVTMAASAMIFTWWASGWRPQWFSRRCEMRSLVHFGVNLTLGGLIYSVARGSDNLLIGRVYGADGLGLYSRATALLVRPLEQFVGPLDAVFVPAFSRLQQEPERYRRAFMRTYESVAMVGAIVTGLLLGLAQPLTLVLLGPRWESASTIFAGFAAVAFFTPLCAACNWLMVSQGRGNDALLASAIVSTVTVGSFLVGIRFGPAGVAVAYSLSGLLIQVPALYHIAGRRGPVSRRELWQGAMAYLPIWGVVCAAAWLGHAYLVRPVPALQLIVGAGTGVLAGVAAVFARSHTRLLALMVLTTLWEFVRLARRSAGSRDELAFQKFAGSSPE